MKILVLNCGSSSIKFQLIFMDDRSAKAEGLVERIGEQTALYTYKSEKYTVKKLEMPIEDHQKGIKLILDNLMCKENGIISDVKEIDAVGHRVVHGGDFYSETALITDEVLERLGECISLAPLHNPANIMGVQAVAAVMPHAPQCGVFDTAFHQTMPAKAYLYALPLELYKKHKIRRYGFHGTSHKFVSDKACEYLNKNIKTLKIITCHLGNGASVTAINKGESIDTSMGLTPLEGLVMGTRCGDMDPAIVINLVKQFGYTIDQANDIILKKSGMLGLSEHSNDMREIENAIKNNCEKSLNALQVYAYRIKKYIGAYIAAMNGCDLIIFTGGVGENMALLRQMVLEDMSFFGINLCLEKNKIFSGEIENLTAAGSKVTILKVPTNEELQIAIETEMVVGGGL